MSKERSKNTAATIPIRMPKDMQKRVRSLAKKSRLADADVMRMALDRGLGVVEKMLDEPKSVAA